MTDNITVCVGIDVSKARLDIALYPGDAFISVSYDEAGLRALDEFVRRHKASRIGFEASGGYEWRLLAHLRGRGTAAARFQPGQIRHFAKSRLQKAKNDRIDARMIAAFTASVEALPALPDARFDDLNAELTYLEQIEEQTTRLKTMLASARLAEHKRLHQKDIAALAKRRQTRIALIARQASADAAIGRRLELLVSIKGIGLRTALALAIRLPELGSLSRQQVASLVGVAPFDDDSGARRGRRHTRGGRDRLRKSLYMSAFTAARCNPHLKACYQRLRANGKHHNCATIAIVRKLAILANAIVARATPWTPQYSQ